MVMDVGAYLILGCDRISSTTCNNSTRAARFVFGQGLLCLLPAGASTAARTLLVIGHGGFRQLLLQLAYEPPAEVESADPPPAPTTAPPSAPPRSSTFWSQPLHADHAELAAAEAATAQEARLGRPQALQCISRFADCMEVL
jgi:hypothetical protein